MRDPRGTCAPKRPAPAPRLSVWSVAAILFVLHPSSFVLSSPAADVSRRYTAAWDDDTSSTGDELGPWGDASSSPRLDGRALFGRPAVRWVQDNTIEPARPATTRVEMVTGDVLPGRVVGMRGGADASGRLVPAHFVVTSVPVSDRPNSSATAAIRVPTRWVRRIVWQPVAPAWRPGVLFARDGRQRPFRAVRFGEESVRLLVESGVEEVPLTEIAELHLTASDPWQAWLEQVAALTPGADGRLIAWETADGLRATASTARFQAASTRPAEDPGRWYHMLQPAWSLDPLWVPFRRIRLRTFLPAEQAPLSRFAPVAVRQQSAFGGSWRWQADRNVEGGPLACGGQLFAWGFGVHALSELQFALPPWAVAFRTRMGLDAAVGEGGSVQASVVVEPGARKLFDSSRIVGSRDVLDSRRLALPDAGGERRLVLLADPLNAERSAGVDPLDVRDHFDWLEPQVEFDVARLSTATLGVAPRLVPAWEGWEVKTGGTPGARLVSQWFTQPSAGYRLLAAGGPLSLSREVHVEPEADLLRLAVSRPEESPASRIEVRVDDKREAEFEVPVAASGRAPKPLEVSLSGYQGRRVRLAISQSSSDSRAVVEWERIELAKQTRP